MRQRTHRAERTHTRYSKGVQSVGCSTAQRVCVTRKTIARRRGPGGDSLYVPPIVLSGSQYVVVERFVIIKERYNIYVSHCSTRVHPPPPTRRRPPRHSNSPGAHEPVESCTRVHATARRAPHPPAHPCARWALGRAAAATEPRTIAMAWRWAGLRRRVLCGSVCFRLVATTNCVAHGMATRL